MEIQSVEMAVQLRVILNMDGHVLEEALHRKTPAINTNTHQVHLQHAMQ